jgi:hypothetical protein
MVKKILRITEWHTDPSHNCASIFSPQTGAISEIFFELDSIYWCFNPGEVIAIDGKTLRHSCDRGGDKKAIHIVSAWATSQRLVLG